MKPSSIDLASVAAAVRAIVTAYADHYKWNAAAITIAKDLIVIAESATNTWAYAHLAEGGCVRAKRPHGFDCALFRAVAAVAIGQAAERELTAIGGLTPDMDHKLRYRLSSAINGAEDAVKLIRAEASRIPGGAIPAIIIL